MIERALLILSGYLIGSVSFAYLAGRLLRGIDLRKYGSGKLSGSNVYHHVSRPAIVLVGLLDIGKAVLPTWLGLQWELGLPTAVAAGLAAMIGHNWSLFLGFAGGRGLGSAGGMLLVVFYWGAFWMLAWVILSRLAPKKAAAPALLGVATLPILAYLLDYPLPTVWGCMGILVIAILKRLEANRDPLPAGSKRWSVLLNRLLLDRDIADFDAWMARTPQTDET
ncbi:MAG: hypothetical protein A2Y73_00285 [Chloroflexi bacterium RBG_13_56_8]|nr:MAG: hypothetical protein A2Y73_00285 [Chloroflexi bacterium RBG_13_56_8]